MDKEGKRKKAIVIDEEGGLRNAEEYDQIPHPPNPVLITMQILCILRKSRKFEQLSLVRGEFVTE